jgi:flagellar hook-basal body complex protein FliE
MQAGAVSSAIANVFNADVSGMEGTMGDLLSPGGAVAGQTPFAGMIRNAIAGVQGLEDQAASEVQGLMTGQGVDIHEAMIATQKADLSFEMALAVRSKAVAAYQQVMQMQF